MLFLAEIGSTGILSTMLLHITHSSLLREDRLQHLFAMATGIGANSSSPPWLPFVAETAQGGAVPPRPTGTPSTWMGTSSPVVCHRHASSSPSLSIGSISRTVQDGFNVEKGGPSSGKRKSPSVTLPFSPLSRILLSPRLRSPSVRHRTSPSTTTNHVDLNVEPEEDNAESGFDTFGDPQPQQNAQRNVVSNQKRREIFDSLLARARNGQLIGHETTEVSEEFSVKIRTVQRIWRQGIDCLDQGLPVDVRSGRFKCGRKKKEVNVSALQDIPVSSHTTINDVAHHLGVSASKVHKLKKEGVIKRVSNSIKPYLTDKNKKDRMKWCLSMIDPRSIPHDPMFRDLFDYVFIDEKWFYITRKTERYYTTAEGQEPVRTCKNKAYIPKIQILTVVARPRFDDNNNCIFDGKIGCFAFVTYEPAKRSSVNRPAGTIEMKPIESITKDVIRSYMVDMVLPAIRSKWPRDDINKPIYIQQDNARPHIAPDDRLFCEAAKQDGFDIRLVCQPANSPDLNVLDLGFFNCIQSIQYKTTAKTTEELVAVVNKAFEDYSPHRSNRIFLTLHGCMKEVMKAEGGNGYDVPHIKKGMLERQGRLPLQLKCDAALVTDVMAKIT